jgi:hypothetical protein
MGVLHLMQVEVSTGNEMRSRASEVVTYPCGFQNPFGCADTGKNLALCDVNKMGSVP